MLYSYLNTIAILAVIKGVCIGGSIAVILAVIVKVIISIYENSGW